jgi:hypothetical protein
MWYEKSVIPPLNPPATFFMLFVVLTHGKRDGVEQLTLEDIEKEIDAVGRAKT